MQTQLLNDFRRWQVPVFSGCGIRRLLHFATLLQFMPVASTCAIF
jgi:hypothetical protein